MSVKKKPSDKHNTSFFLFNVKGVVFALPESKIMTVFKQVFTLTVAQPQIPAIGWAVDALVGFKSVM